jgi:hypothetical protein
VPEDLKMFCDLDDRLQVLLRDLSRDGFLYLGRTGAGLTYNFRRACYLKGTIKAIEETAEFHDDPCRLILELVAVEGPKWVSYERIQERALPVIKEVVH